MSARIWSMICVLLLVQSMGESSRESMGAYVACDSSCGTRCAVPFSICNDGLSDRIRAEHSELFEQVLRRLVGTDGLLFD